MTVGATRAVFASKSPSAKQIPACLGVFDGRDTFTGTWKGKVLAILHSTCLNLNVQVNMLT